MGAMGVTLKDQVPHINLCSFTFKEWDKYRVAFVLQGKPHYVEEDDKVINTKVCILNMNQQIKTKLILTLRAFDNSPISGVSWNGFAIARTSAGRQTLDWPRTHKQG